MLGRAKNLIQAALLITEKVLTSHFTLWRVTGGVGRGLELCWYMCCFLPLGIFVVVHSPVFPSHTKSKSLCCSCGPEGVVSALLPISIRQTWWWTRGNFGLLDRTGMLRLLCSLWAVGDWALSGLLVATKISLTVISHCVGPGNLWLSVILFSFGRTLT